MVLTLKDNIALRYKVFCPVVGLFHCSLPLRFRCYTLRNVPSRKSNRLKYRSGSGSRNIIFNGSVPVQVQDFSKIWVQVRIQWHQNLKVRVRFRFNDLEFKRFRFGSGSPKKSGFCRFAVQVRVRFDSLLASDSLDFETQKECYAS